ncbi:toll/interleukin-1 receptor domain-containing protein [Paraburkholderia sp. LEh10]|uniref:toll/interleukin-1 receptor domain-containing protein n=1 Tax=Paraburkholderia sp. LEh10 TaxID=2821353 RepID=UPI001AE81F03|nr:toll/interleukin-1 receptor domain-containing protein [Paraburkholderia sp. LEh10]MBP0593613.1 toll/interleukin-1 receptor domain-containing protein [Paraburkholderia sp. LEh10]
MSYEWDIFLSYPRLGDAGQWVENHFHPRLKECLTNELAQPPRIFLDREQPTGVEWPENLKQALLQSRIMVAVWTPPYFASRWCMAEWTSMLEREIVLDKRGRKPARGLVFPVIYSDGKHFDPRAKQIQINFDFTEYNHPFKHFDSTPLYIDFNKLVKDLAISIDEHLTLAPEWEDGWPALEPPAVQTQSLELPRL